MGNVSALGDFEQLVLLAVLRLGREAYGVALSRELEERTGAEVSRGAVYTTLDRLEEKGLLRSFQGAARPMRGGRARRIYQVEPEGIEALQAARSAVRSLWSGLEPLLGDL
jgi:PadR family transcriptional regulator PadR